MASDRTVSITADLVSAYLSNAAVGPDEIPRLAEHVPELIRRIHDAFANLPGAGTVSADGQDPVSSAASPAGHETHAAGDALVASQPVAGPAVPIEQCVTADHVVCLEDGLRFKSLRPHLISAHGLTPQAYRAKWGLPADHPIVAPSYSKQRAEVAKSIGLGKGGRKSRTPRKRGPK